MPSIEGYVYAPDSRQETFANAARDHVIRNPDRSPPWIVVNHTIEAVIVTPWPGRLWRVEVLDANGVEQVSPQANYTRAIAVKVLEEVPAWRLFGEHGEAVVRVLSYASGIDAAAAERLGRSRHPDASQAYSRAWDRWLDRVGHKPGQVNSPLNCGLSLVARAVEERAEAVAGRAAFVEDDEGERELGPVWGSANSALLHAAMALGAPSFVLDDAPILLTAWSTEFAKRNDLSEL